MSDLICSNCNGFLRSMPDFNRDIRNRPRECIIVGNLTVCRGWSPYYSPIVGVHVCRRCGHENEYDQEEV